ncbi:PadR family transcriptional regulator [Acetobacterium bakii]|uniref:PadR family transcriptional regulator n=1 Tax=Acetobacterium bakii TaxID=52689 RepID=A0A0L6U074_9FIRM|nr:PadR family transcriptional regulator [Acetobacterium bakii]KNZ41899.1 PadR family transcriptional regulator [Acetobacterium bakii]
MRILKHVILGLLNRSSMSGYDITNEFHTTVSEFWTASHSQIYPELKKLTEEGLVTYEIQITGEVLEKKVYSITPKGKQQFINWLKIDVPMEPTPKSVFRLKIFFSDQLSPERRKYLLNSQILQHRQRLEHLKANHQKFKNPPKMNSPELGDYLVLEGAIMREEMTLKWLEKCLDYT